MPNLVVPGVRVEARFDVLPPLPAAAGILGVVGIVDRPPAGGGVVGVSKIGEIPQVLGPGTGTSTPELVHALANGLSEAIVSPVLGGAPARLDLLNQNSAAAVRLRCRSNGSWGNDLRVEVRGIANAEGNIVRTGIRLLRSGRTVENFSDLRIAPGQPDDLFDTLNGSSRFVVAVDPGNSDAVPADGTYVFNDDGDPIDVPRTGDTQTLFQLLPAADANPSGLSVRIDAADAKHIDVRVLQGGLQEEFTDLTTDPDDARHIQFFLLTQSRLIRVRPVSSLAEGERLPAATVAPEPFEDGESPTVDQYRDAIDLLSESPRVDMILAAVEPGRNNAETHQIHQALLAHAVRMTDEGAPRIAFGSVTHDEQPDLGKIRDHAATVRNRRFVLISPSGAAGAVAGVIGRLNPQESPTFKPVPLHDLEQASYRESQLNRLLGPSTNLLVVQERAGRGIVVLRGIDATGDQISVTRVADQAIRETKAIAENFIGRLNSEEARIALKEQIIATFTRMERAGALVPSTDGSDPAFVVDVYSTQQDFSQGIVRIDIAVRPVRAIDFIYATIRVKN